MKKLKYIFFLILSLLLIVACENKKEKEESKSEVDKSISANSFDEVIKDGGFYFNNKGKVVPVREVKDQKILEWYSEPRCPHCHTLEQQVKDYLLEIMGDNTLIKYNPISFIGRKKDDPSHVTYSDDLSGLMLAIAKNDPNIAYPFMKEVQTEIYATLNYENSSRLKAFEDTYKKLGGKKWDEINKDLKEATRIVFENTQSLPSNEKVKSKTKTGIIETPLLFLQNEDKAFDYVNASSTEIKKALEERLK